MNPQLETLIMLQDLDLMIKEMSDKKTASQMSRIGFEVNAVENLRQARRELAAKIEPNHLSAYTRLTERYQRAIVPVRNGVCLGCFLKQPTRYSSHGSDAVHLCGNCKRFIYFI